jgi:predicted nucleic acid-binding protein
MKYVLDSSVALKWVLSELDSAKAIQLRDDYLSGVHELLAPDVFHVEAGHALTRAERSGRIAPPAGWVLWQSIMADCPRLHASLPLMPRAYQISSQMRIGIYDCLYVALAEQAQCQLVTADSRLHNATGSTFPFILLLGSVP